MAFAPADNPQIAVAVVVESKDVAATGGKLAAGVQEMTYAAQALEPHAPGVGAPGRQDR